MSEASTEQLLTACREKTLGILGGGQLGRMFVQAAQAMGFQTVVLCADQNEPAAQISDAVMCASYLDHKALAQLAACCLCVTTEFENVPADSLAFLADPARHVRVTPSAQAVRIAQDRTLEKAHIKASGIPTAPYRVMDSQAALEQALAGEHRLADDFYPAILKTSRMGYDGKGQITVQNAAQLAAAWAQLAHVSCVLERRLPLAAECSVLLARQVEPSGQERVICWPVQHNVHVDGILATTHVAQQGTALQPLLDQALTEAAQTIARTLNYEGVLCVEFFILTDGSWVVNEIAPRPHNSGHVTMDGSTLSQFEAQVRVAAGLPLAMPRQHSSVVMVNLLGDVWFDRAQSQQPREPDWARVLALGTAQVGVHLHLYGKHEARRGRKMGHINITATTQEQAWQTAQSIQQLLQ